MTKDELEDAFWNEGRESYVVRETIEPASQRTYDLDERTACFGKAIIDFANVIPRTSVTRPLIEQLVGCGTSVGANYCEADDAVSKKGFRLRSGTGRKETRETKYFLRVIVRAVPELKSQARPLWQEAKELHLVFAGEAPNESRSLVIRHS